MRELTLVSLSTYTGGFGTIADVGTDRDEELVDALRQREPTAAERLIARYGDRAYRLAARITGNTADAEEVIQDAIVSVVRKIDTFRRDSSLGSWIYRITANAAYEKLRGRRRRRDEISLDEVLPLFDENGRYADAICDWSASIHDPAVQSELRAALISAIGDLPAHYRAVIVMRDVEGMSVREVAGCVRTTVAAVKIRTHRARLFLRKRLSVFMASVIGPTIARQEFGRPRALSMDRRTEINAEPSRRRPSRVGESVVKNATLASSGDRLGPRARPPDYGLKSLVGSRRQR
jgi:RNA polymerase sigma-70 factor, ECF subfamily